MKLLHRIWTDEQGVIATTDLILVSTILGVGVIVGLTTFRDQVVQELGDVAVAVGHFDQSYSFSGATITFNGSTFVVAGSSFADTSDDCETGTNECDPGNDPPGAEPACIEICGIAATPE